jgi:uncharacterized protein YdhG (YjbR/CyaY superfamily)
MAETRATKKGRAQKSTKGAATKRKSSGLSAEERAAMKERVRELKAEARRGRRKADGESDVLAKIAEMPEADRAMATRLHELIKEAAPALLPKSWYGMPAYANEEGKVVCFFRNAAKFKERYAMFGFNDSAKLDDGSMWPIAFALTKLTKADEKKIATLVKKAVS